MSSCSPPCCVEPSVIPASSTHQAHSQQLHVLDHWSAVKQQLKDKQLYVFLDYDGTLTPIVSQPSAALLSASMRSRLSRLVQRRGVKVAVVTGRNVNKIKQMVDVEGIYYAGSHGFDISTPTSSHSVAREFLPVLRAFHVGMASALVVSPISGVEVEDNVFNVSVHYRNVAEADRPRVKQLVSDVLGSVSSGGSVCSIASSSSLPSPPLVLHSGKMVWEVRPNFAWNKGKAVDALLKDMRGHLNETHEQAKQLDNIAIVYIGDDTTDEDAFLSLCCCSSSVITILVHSLNDSASSSATASTRLSFARYRLSDVDEVGEFIDRLHAI